MSMDGALLWLEQRSRDLERLLGELVEISSHTEDRGGVSRVAARFADAARELGRGALSGAPVASASGRYGDHLRLETAARGPAMVLIGHHDTVFPQPSFSGFREDGPLLRGPGVLDMKGGLAVIAYSLGALAEVGMLARLPLKVVSVADEEVGSPEGRTVIEAALGGAQAALVFESGRPGDAIVTRRKGTGSLKVRASGKAAHAGNYHHEGANAIWALARFVDRAQSLTDYARGVTVNVGRIAGGIGKNTVPDSAEALVDFRFVTVAQADEVKGALAEAAALAANEVPGTALRVEGGIARLPLERTEASAALAAEYARAARASGLGFEEAGIEGGGSDASTAHALGVPAIDGLGPRGIGFHTVDEQIERASLVPKAQALVRFLAGRLS